MAKLPRISSSGDDTAVGQTVPSTTVDPSSGTGTTLSASSSNVNVTGDAGKRAMVVKPVRKVWHQWAYSDKSSYVSSLELVCIGSVFVSSSF